MPLLSARIGNPSAYKKASARIGQPACACERAFGVACLLFALMSSQFFLLKQMCLAQSASGNPVFPTGPLPTDLTPIRIREETEVFTPGPTFYLYNKLPPSLWFNFTCETNQRVETNIFLKNTAAKTDYIYRTFPNITLGYQLFKGFSIYSNYFVIKDVYAQTPKLTGPTTQSISMGLRYQKPIGNKSTFQFDFQSRELFQDAGLHQADLLPAVLINRVLTPRLIAYANVTLQMRGANYFVAPTRELDPFYTVGFLYSRGRWLFSAVDTLITNYRVPPFSFAVPMHGNEAMIADFEIAHPVHKKLPGVMAFVRAEPIWNWNSGGTPGISGFDFRLYSGFRFYANKVAHNTSVDTLRKQLLEMQSGQNDALPSTAPGSAMPSNTKEPDGKGSLSPRVPTNQSSEPGSQPASQSSEHTPASSEPASQSSGHQPASNEPSFIEISYADVSSTASNKNADNHQVLGDGPMAALPIRTVAKADKVAARIAMQEKPDHLNWQQRAAVNYLQGTGQDWHCIDASNIEQ